MTDEDYEVLGEVIAKAVKYATKPLVERIAALEGRAFLYDKGLWTHGQTYEPGAVVTKDGSSWVCSKTHFSTGNDLDHGCFRLMVKSGRDGRNLR